jgi:hypothetical protein
MVVFFMVSPWVGGALLDQAASMASAAMRARLSGLLVGGGLWSMTGRVLNRCCWCGPCTWNVGGRSSSGSGGVVGVPASGSFWLFELVLRGRGDGVCEFE